MDNVTFLTSTKRPMIIANNPDKLNAAEEIKRKATEFFLKAADKRTGASAVGIRLFSSWVITMPISINNNYSFKTIILRFFQRKCSLESKKSSRFSRRHSRANVKQYHQKGLRIEECASRSDSLFTNMIFAFPPTIPRASIT